MALSTAGTYLMYETATPDTYAKLCDIRTYPDLGNTPNKLDTTTLSNLKYKTSIFGLQEELDFTFEALYDETVLTTIAGLTGTQSFKVCFGDETGTDGGISWDGEIVAYANGGEVDAVRLMTIVCTASTEPVVI